MRRSRRWHGVVLVSLRATLGGARVPSDRPVDSVSLLPNFEDPARPSLRQWLFADQSCSEHGVETGGYAVRDNRYKLIARKGRSELYDLESDLGEENDLLADGISEKEQATVRRLRGIVDGLR